MKATSVLDGLSVSALARHRDAIVDAAEAADDAGDMLAVVSDRIARLIPFDGACWFGTDPDTLFASLPVRIENVERGHCHTYWEREFLVEDALLFRDMVRDEVPAGTLLDATDQLPERSARYREFLAPQGFGDELRFLMGTDAATWGLVALMRDEAAAAFTPRETAFAASLAAPLAAAVRRKALFGRASTETGTDAPGMVMYDCDGVMTSLNAAAEEWFDELGAGSTHPGDPPVSIVTVMAHARAVARGRQRGSAMLRVRGRSGRWATLHASCLQSVDGAAGPTAVVIERSAPSHLRPFYEQAYGLSPREQQVTDRLARGLSTSAIARDLHLSEHTVRDHVKAILAKVGVSTRAELVAHLFAEFVEPSLDDAPVHFGLQTASGAR